MKLCENCVYYDGSWPASTCKAPQVAKLNMVQGGMRELKFCDEERLAGWFMARMLGNCGREGRFFELKQL